MNQRYKCNTGNMKLKILGKFKDTGLGVDFLDKTLKAQTTKVMGW